MAVAPLTPQKSNLESYSIVWFDPSANNSSENVEARQHLRETINYLKIFKKSDECLVYIRSVPKEDRILMIVSGRLGQEIVPRIHHLRQVSSIYVYCMDKKKNEQWAQPFNKVKRIIVHLGELVKKIRDDHIQRQYNKMNELFAINVFYTNIDDPGQSINEINNSFLYSYLLIDCLHQTKSALTDKTDLLAICKKQYKGNDTELQILDEFEQNYSPSQALWWYTRQTFLYRLLKKALEIYDLQLLLLCRFFICDIERQLEKTKLPSPLRVEYTDGDQRVLFEIEADPQLNNIKSFSNITTQLFFNVRLDQDEIWTVRMVLCSETDHQLKTVFDPKGNKDALSFGQGFCQLKRFDDAEIYYQHLLKSLPTDHEDIVLCYEALANLEKEKGDYQSSLQWLNKSLEMKINTLEIDHSSIGDSYNNIGEVYLRQKDFKQAYESFHRALEFYQKALVIRQKRFPQDHPQLSDSYKNNGTAYQYLENLDQALEHYNRSLKIYTKSVSPPRFIIGILLKSIGSIYENKKQLQQARAHYEKAAISFRRVLSSTDPHSTQIQEDIQRVASK